MGIWDVRSKKGGGASAVLVEVGAQNGLPPQIKWMRSARASQMTEYISKSHKGPCELFCTVGEHHIKLWSFSIAGAEGTSSGAPSLMNKVPSTMKMQPSPPMAKVYTCCEFLGGTDGSSDLVAGGNNGIVYLYRKAVCVAVCNAIKGGVKCLTVFGGGGGSDNDLSVCVGGANGGVKVLCGRTLAVLLACNAFPGNSSIVGVGRPSSASAGGKSPRLISSASPKGGSRAGSAGRPASASRLGGGGGGGGGGAVMKAGKGPDGTAEACCDITGVAVFPPSFASSSSSSSSRGGARYIIVSTAAGKTIKISLTGGADGGGEAVSRPRSAGGNATPTSAASAAASNGGVRLTPLFYYHTSGELWGVSTGGGSGILSREGGEGRRPIIPIASCSDDRRLCVWDAVSRKLLARTSTNAAARCVHFDKSNTFLAVGTQAGSIHVYELSAYDPSDASLDEANSKGEAFSAGGRAIMQRRNGRRRRNEYVLREVAFRKDAREGITDCKFSHTLQEGEGDFGVIVDLLAAASSDDTICVYTCAFSPEGGCIMRPLHRLRGHSSYVTHIDWSRDGSLIKSTSGAYEVLVHEADTAKLFTSPTIADIKFRTDHCPLSFSLMGIWAPCTDGTDINSVDVNKELGIVATGDDDGKVNIMNYPCVVKHAPRIINDGHGSHVTNVRFFPPKANAMAVSEGGLWGGGEGTVGLVSGGGGDCAVIIWSVKPPPTRSGGAKRYVNAL